MEKRNICLSITHIRSHVTFGNNLPEAKAKKVRFYFVTLEWHRSTCFLNRAILIGDLVDVTTLLPSTTKHNSLLHPTHSTKLLSCCLSLKTMFFSHLFSGLFLYLLHNPMQPQPTVLTRLPTTPTQWYHHLSKE